LRGLYLCQMSMPLFYHENLDVGNNLIVLDEHSSKHIVQVLRMKEGDEIELTDGIGNIYTVRIEKSDKKKCEVRIKSSAYTAPATKKTAIAISLLKNNSRFEWFLEKATEIGVTEIMPLICARTERQHYRFDRMKNILVSAILQSRQPWLPVLNEPLHFNELIQEINGNYENKFIAHCDDGEKKLLANFKTSNTSRSVILIGPEGDFTADEIAHAKDSGFLPVSLGETRLRTETAGMVAAVLLNIP
jgi:16S rRNA (uracil1498-N3)-methyltransferase